MLRLSHDADALCRWIIPFSRQFLASAISLAPLVPWAWKMALLKAWLVRCYYHPCGLAHLIPTGGDKDMNYTGGRHLHAMGIASSMPATPG